MNVTNATQERGHEEVIASVRTATEKEAEKKIVATAREFEKEMKTVAVKNKKLKVRTQPCALLVS